jgi:hypothetical protein
VADIAETETGLLVMIRRRPADKVERRPISTLIPYAKNARTHSRRDPALNELFLD